MRNHLRAPLAMAASALMTLALLTHAVFAQDDTIIVSVEVLGDPCLTFGVTTIVAAFGGNPEETAIQRESPTSGTGDAWPMTLKFDVLNAGCNQWSITAGVSDFKLESDPTTSFSGSSLRIARDPAYGFELFERWASQPAWINSLPAGTFGNSLLPALFAQEAGRPPTLANSISFEGSNDAYTGSGPLLQANPAFTNGSPGNMSGYYVMRLFNLPTDLYLNPGIYSAELTISLQGPD